MADTLRRKLGFERIHSDARVYVLRRQGGNQTEIILILYIDDLLLQLVAELYGITATIFCRHIWDPK